jgi:Caspase domain/Putative peptidoglycan binding domain
VRTDPFRWITARRRTRLMGPLETLLRALAAVVVLAWPTLADVPPDKRVALVIGNGAYQNAPTLDNAAFDARAVADAFRKLGFIVVDGYNLNINEMREKISAFSADLPGAKSAVMYYAGHGISVDGENYLIPIDITLKSPTDLDLGAISVSLVLKQMKREERVDIVVLDACRDNPFAAALARAKTRSIVGERGLSRIDGDLARGTLIAFASDPGSTALDGPPGQHSPFTAAFLDHVFDPGVSIDTVMSRVRAEVWEKTNHGQLPWVNTSLIGDYALNPEAAPEPARAEATKSSTAAAAPDRQSQEDLLWESAQHSNLPGDYRAYLDAFPNGFFARMAKNRIAALENPGVARSETAKEAPNSAEKDWRVEIGTPETENALNLTPADEKEIQLRLTALGLYMGPATGALDLPTRQAITEWQKRGGAALSSYLGPMQLAKLREESEEAYRKLLAADQAPKPKAAETVTPTPHAARPRAVDREPVVRERAARERAARERAVREEAAREPAKTWRRHRARRPSQPAAAAAEPAPAPRCNGNPIWCRQAGLPVDGPEPGRPPGF